VDSSGGRGRRQVVAEQRRQPPVPPQGVEVIQTLPAQRTQQHERFDELRVPEAFRRFLRRQVPVSRTEHAAATPQLDQQRDASVRRHRIRQATPQIEVQRVWQRSAAHRLHLQGEAYTIEPTDWGSRASRVR
jgi:hypothetical protein